MNKYRVYSKDGRVERCRLTKVEYSGTFMGDRVVTSSFTSATEIAFDVFDYIEFRGEKFELEMIPTVKKVSSYQYEYDLRFVSLKYELERCMFRDFVPNDNEVVYPTPVTVEFTGKVNYLTERIQACLDRMYGAGVWSIVVSEGVDSEEKNLSLSNQNCWNALSLVNTEYKLNFHINGRTVVVGDSEAVQGVVFEYGKGNGLYEIERAADSDTGIVTKLIAYGGTRNLDYSYPKKPEWSDSVLPNTFILSPLRLMLPSFKKDGKTDYLLADDALIAKYGIREGVMMYDDIYPTITGATNSKGERIDKIAGVDAITDEETFDVYLNDLGFDLNDSLTTETPQLVMKTGALQGYAFNIKTIGALSNGGVRVTLEKNSIDNSDTGGYYIPNKDFNMSVGDEFVLLGILMPQLYIRNAEQRLEERAREYLNQYSTTNYSYSIGVDEIFMAKNPSVMAEVFEGKKMKINDAEIGIDEELVTIQSLTIEDGDGLIPRIKVTLNNNPSASTLERIQGQIANIESTANSQYSAQTELAKQYQRKLNTSYFNRLFVAIDANGNEIAPNDTTTPIASVRVNYGLWTEQFLSAKGMNSGGGSDEPTGGATTLGGLRNVAADADRTYDVAKMLVLEAKSNLWSLKNLSDLVGGLDEAELAEYLTNNNYAKKSDIPSLSGYATEQWVLGKGYLTEHQDLSAYAKKTDIPTIPTKVSAFENDADYATTSDLDNRIDALVNGAPQAYDTLKEIADVLAGNVNSISDILTALGNKADKATTLSGYGITDAYTISQIDSIVNGLSGNISTLQGYFTDGVANSALKLSDNGSYTAWGQTFFTNGKPKSVSGALTDVTDITSSGTITTNKIVIGNGTIEWDEANKGFKVTGLYSTTYLSAKGANTNGGSSSGDGLITSLYRYADLGKTFADTNNDTFNAYTINKINTDLGNRISVLEGKATNVSFTQSLTSGTQIGSISIDGVAKNIYAPTIPTSDINKGVTAHGWGNHASVGYAMASALGGYLPLSGGTITGNLIIGGILNVSSHLETRKHHLFVINNEYADWIVTDKDWQNEYAIIHSGNYTDYAYSKSTIDTKLGGYLPLSGGTLYNGVDNAPLTIKGTTTDAYVRFALNNDTFLGALGINKTLGLVLWDVATSQNRVIIHSGNYTDYTYSKSTIDGKFGGLGTLAYKSSLAFADLTGKPTTIGGYGITDAYTIAQIDSIVNGLSSDISTLEGYFTDGVANSALKLATARIIWGQSFDGTADVSGYVYSLGLRTNGEYGLYKGNLFSNSLTENDTVLFGEKVILWGGNVGIGTLNPQYKLDVNGSLHASDVVTLDKELIGNGWKISQHRSRGVLPFGLELHGSNEVFGEIAYYQDHFIVGNFRNGTENAIINFYDNGNVTINPAACCGVCMRNPQYALDVNGVIHSNTGIFSDGYVSAKGQNTSSDMRLKNVLNDVVLGVKDIANAPSVRFSWKNGGSVDVGSSAQYWQGLLPDAVKERDGMLEMQYANIALLSAIAIAKNVETHEERIARLEKENEELRNEISMMKGGNYE